MQTVDVNTAVAWCDKGTLMKLGIPDHWLRSFVSRHGDSTRKLGDAPQSKRLYSIAAVNAAIEAGEVA